MIFIFDVDGTLTPSRSLIDPHFYKWFSRWTAYQQQRQNQVWLISGSDYPKTVEQMGQDLVDSVDRCYNCMGNTLYMNKQTVYERQFDLTPELKEFLELQLETSAYPERYGNHIEQRPGMINFSIVGRGAVGQQRTDYYLWDQQQGERARLTEEINTKFRSLNIQAHVGGETGLDITKTGWDKGQIVSEINEPAIFFGDKMNPGENDYPLRKALAQHNCGFKHKSYHVDNWSNTMSWISSYM